MPKQTVKAYFLHCHECPKCNNRWCHSSKERGNIGSHTCPACGEIQWTQTRMPPLPLTIERNGNRLTAHCMIGYEDREGTKALHIRSTIDIDPLKRDAMHTLKGRVGWLWDDIVHDVDKIATRAGHLKLIRQLNDIVNDPRFKESIELASAIFPPLGVTYATAIAATKLAKAARGGDTDAQAAIASIAFKASTGKDLKAMELKKALDEIKKAHTDVDSTHASVAGNFFEDVVRALAPHHKRVKKKKPVTLQSNVAHAKQPTQAPVQAQYAPVQPQPQQWQAPDGTMITVPQDGPLQSDEQAQDDTLVNDAGTQFDGGNQ